MAKLNIDYAGPNTVQQIADDVNKLFVKKEEGKGLASTTDLEQINTNKSDIAELKAEVAKNISAILLITVKASADYNGYEVTATSKLDGSYTYTETIQDGSALIKVGLPGEYEISNTLDEKTVTVLVGETLMFEVTLSSFKGTIQVTVPELLIGETIQATNGTDTVEALAESTTVELSVESTGSWDVGVKDNEFIQKQTVVLSDDQTSQNCTLDISSGVPIITVTLAEDFTGETVICSKDDIEVKKKSADNNVQFLIKELGEYTLKLESLDNIQESVNVESAKEYQIELTLDDTTLPILIVTSKAEDNGKTIKVSKDAHNLEKVLEDGKAMFVLPETGEWTIKCDDYPEITKSVNATENIIYKVSYRSLLFGIKITETNEDSEARVAYTDDAIGMTPLSVDTSSGSVNYNGWDETWIFNKFYPVMLKTNGTIDYKLDPNDYSKKADGGDSDVANTSYNGNAMVCVEKFYIKYSMDGENECIQISEEKQEGFEAIGFIREDGSEADRIFLPMFLGNIVSNKLRSLSGQPVLTSTHPSVYRTAAQNNGSGYDLESWAMNQMLQAVCLILVKNSYIARCLGWGRENDDAQTGMLNTKGPIAYDPKSSCTKFMHIEDFVTNGNGSQRVEVGALAYNKKLYIKMKPPYSFSSTSGYDVMNGYVHYTTKNGNKNIHQMMCSNKYGRIPIKYDERISETSLTYEVAEWNLETYDTSAYYISSWGNNNRIAGRDISFKSEVGSNRIGAALTYLPSN